ncbi:hypothetical protein BDV11DRAFT_141586 [Aspergillus similis]
MPVIMRLDQGSKPEPAPEPAPELGNESYNVKDKETEEIKNEPQVHIVEVSPRDGLQNIPEFISTETKVALIRRLAGTGLRTIEIASIVSPKAVPQLADWRDVLGHRTVRELSRSGWEGPAMETGSASASDSDSDSESSRQSESGFESETEPELDLEPREGLSLPILLPNLKGLSLLLSHSPRPAIGSICVFISATGPFSHRNINCSVGDGLLRAAEVTVAAKKAGIPRVRGYISCIFTDPITHERTDPSAVLHCTRFLLESGVDEIALSDTDGSGTAGLTSSLLRYLLENGVPVDRLACHFHDTRGRGLENAWAAYEVGVRVFDGSVAGLGGCPFAPGARGNVDTGSLVKMFEGNGVRTGVDLGLLDEVGKWVKGRLRGYREGGRNGDRNGTRTGLGAGKDEREERNEWIRAVGTAAAAATTTTTTRTGEHCGWAFSRPLGIER